MPKIPLSNFQYQEETKLYLPSKGERYFDDDFVYSDGTKIENYILNTIKKATDITDESEELMQGIKDWPSYYHLAMGRSNILKSITLPANIKILELGCGCGAVTRYLGENFKEVDAVEGSCLRAQIASERCRNLQNVRICCSHINNIEFEPAYDLVTLIGVLEYAPLYFKANDNKDSISACLSLLRLAKSSLKSDGALVLAIENKIGLKYLSGCPEDHTGKIYEGIHGYPVKNNIITFSKNEIECLLKSVGFQQIFFYYCFPDYKFASVILSDIPKKENLYLHNWIDTPFKSYGPPRVHTFHEGLALNTLSRAGLLRELANSFLVLATQNLSSPIYQPDWAAKKFTTFKRRKVYRCITTLKVEPEPYIEKVAIYEKNMTDEENNGNLKIKHRVANSTWHKGDLLIFEVYSALVDKNFKSRILDLFKEYHKELLLRYNTRKLDKDGIPLLQGDSIEFILRNIIRGENNTLVFIDSEWYIDGLIPADYVMFRCIIHDVTDTMRTGKIRKIRDVDGFTIKLLRNFFPNYNKKRHSANKSLEESFQNFVLMNFASIEKILSAKRFSFFRKKSFWRMSKTVWDKLPTRMRRGIKKYFIGV